MLGLLRRWDIGVVCDGLGHGLTEGLLDLDLNIGRI